MYVHFVELSLVNAMTVIKMGEPASECGLTPPPISDVISETNFTSQSLALVLKPNPGSTFNTKNQRRTVYGDKHAKHETKRKTTYVTKYKQQLNTHFYADPLGGCKPPGSS